MIPPARERGTRQNGREEPDTGMPDRARHLHVVDAPRIIAPIRVRPSADTRRARLHRDGEHDQR